MDTIHRTLQPAVVIDHVAKTGYQAHSSNRHIGNPQTAFEDMAARVAPRETLSYGE